MVGVRGGQSDLEDIESRGGESEYDGEGSVPRDSGHSQPIPIPVPRGMSTTVFKAALPLLDAVDLEMEFQHRAHVFKSVPWIMKGPVRTAYRFALSTILEATQTRDVELETRAFKAFFMISRLLLFKPAGVQQVPPAELARRIQLFSCGQWEDLLRESRIVIPRRNTKRANVDEHRALRAEALVALGELSAARQALEAAEIAPGTDETFRILSDADRRPASLRDLLPAAVQNFVPDEVFVLDYNRFVANLRGARKGAAASPSGVTADHLKILLDEEDTTELLYKVGQKFAAGGVPGVIVKALRVGRMTALQKPDGGVRGIVAGDVFRRLVSRTMAKQLAQEIQKATSPF